MNIRVAGALLLLAVPAGAQEWKRLIGDWKFDATASAQSGGGRGNPSGRGGGGGGGGGGGIGLGPPPLALSIAGDDTSLTIREIDGDSTLATIHYRFNGKAVRNTLTVGGGRRAEVTHRSKWRGAVLESTITRSISNAKTTTTVRLSERIYVRSDSAIVQEITLKGRGGRSAVYRR